VLEREMEDLIAANPDHFFPGYGFLLQGRQQSFHGVGRFDLLFADRHGMTILMELKAVPARYEVIDQVARYRDALVAQGIANIIMWIVAPSIPYGMREFLSHLGIEFSEIHEAEFKRAAIRFGYALRDMAPDQQNVASERNGLPGPTTFSASPAPGGINAEIQTVEQPGIDDWGFGTGTQPSFLIRALESGGKTKENIRSEFIAHFYPGIPYAEAKGKSGFNVFFSDSKRPVSTYHASRSLLILKDAAGCLSLDPERAALVKAAIAGGILTKLRGLDFKRDKAKFNEVISSFGLPPEL